MPGIGRSFPAQVPRFGLAAALATVTPAIDTTLACAISETQVIESQFVYDPLAAPPAFLAPLQQAGTLVHTEGVKRKRAFVQQDEVSFGFIPAAASTPIDTTLACAIGETQTILSQIVYDPLAAPPKFQLVVQPTVIQSPSDQERRAGPRKQFPLSSFVFAIPDDSYGIEGSDQNRRAKKRAFVQSDDGGVSQEYVVVVPPAIDTTLAGAFGETTTILSRVVYDMTTGPHRAPDAVRTTPTQLAFVPADRPVNAKRKVVQDNNWSLLRPIIATVPPPEGSDQNRKTKPFYRQDESGMIPQPYVVVVPPSIDTTLAGAFGETVTILSQIVYDMTTGPLIVPAVVTPPVVEPPPDVGGDRIVGGHFSRGQWHNLKEAWRAQREAEERAEAQKRKKKRLALERAAKAAAIALRAIRKEEEESAAVNAKVQAMTWALEAANGAESLRTIIEKSNLVVQIAKAIAQQIEDDDEEEEAIALLLALD